MLAFLSRSCSDLAFQEESIAEKAMKGNKSSAAKIDKRD